jgi:hypothetical protein
MKTILTLIFVLFISVAAQAQDASIETKAATVEMTIATSTSYEDVVLENTTEVARLYKFKNSRIKKALAFTTKRNKAKMA